VQKQGIFVQTDTDGALRVRCRLPFRFSPSSEANSFVNLYAGNLSSKGLAVSFFLALLTFFLCRNKVSLYRRILMALCVCAAGLSGIVALLFLPWNKYE
jgi:hypothetical protein